MGKPASERYTSLDLIKQKRDGNGVAVAPAGSYANHLHLAPLDR